jgi:hypothetical protein
MKTNELIGQALDWAVAKCEEVEIECIDDGITRCLLRLPPLGGRYQPSTDWDQGGPIIDREKIGLVYYPDMNCMTGEVLPKWIGSNVIHSATGPTPLIAAMRCYVASKLGNEVDIPEELL